MTDFSHVDKTGMPAMVNVSEKKTSKRSATARSIVVLPKDVLDKLEGQDIQTKRLIFQTAICSCGRKKNQRSEPLFISQFTN
jgi:cyclic pyranopterin phosphate synthase